MASQPSDASYVSYVENFLDATTDMPDEIQRYVSRIKEYDSELHGHVKEANRLMDILTSDSNEDSKSVAAMTLQLQNLLIKTQEIGDSKLEMVQQIQDIIDKKSRQLDLDRKNCNLELKSENVEPTAKAEPAEKKRVRRARQISIFDGTQVSPGTSQIARKSPDEPSIETSHRVAHSSTAPPPSSANQHHGSNAPSTTASTSRSHEKHQVAWSSTANITSTASTSTANKQEKKVEKEVKEDKKKCRRKKKSSNSPQNLPVDPDEPTYCLCDQISYGDMIGCDNDLCPIEWFHFSCVSLTNKPKGKWFCPKCRGDRPTVMKPKALFLKELERYNKEKEEKA